jgi:hypothetical protein
MKNLAILKAVMLISIARTLLHAELQEGKYTQVPFLRNELKLMDNMDGCFDPHEKELQKSTQNRLDSLLHAAPQNFPSTPSFALPEPLSGTDREAALAALAALERASAAQPRNASLLMALAHLVDRVRGNRTEAALLYRAAAVAEPANAGALSNLGFVQVLGQY